MNPELNSEEKDKAAESQQQASGASTSNENVRGFFYRMCENVDNAVKSASGEAKNKAANAAPKVKQFVERGAYEASYATAYGIVFGSLVAKQLLKDNPFVAGVKDGVRAARKSAAERDGQASAADSESTPSTGAGGGIDGMAAAPA